MHSLSPTTWLSGVRPKPTQGVDAYAGVTADQIAAAAIGQDTLLPSIELATEDHSGLDRRVRPRLRLHLHEHALLAHANVRRCRWRSTRVRCSSGCSAKAAAKKRALARRREDRSILDALTAQATGLQHQLGGHDRETLDLLSRRCARDRDGGSTRAESQIASNPDLEIPEAPAGIPFEYEDHVATMFDLLALAYRADITRVFTFMMAREVSNRTYTQVGVTEGHHAVSHHQNRAEKLEMSARIQTLPHWPVRQVPREARRHARRRRLAARQYDPSLRQQHEQQQRP